MNFRILCYDTLNSTNNQARLFAERGAKQGTVISAEYQTQGRGRFKRRWFSRRGKDLLFSIILRPKFRLNFVSIITHITALAIRDLLREEFHLPAKLKRPNDVLIDSQKVAGVLTEASSRSDRLEYLIVGVGLNVNSKPGEIPKRATSIFNRTKKQAERKTLLQDFLVLFSKYYRGLSVNRRFGKP